PDGQEAYRAILLGGHPSWSNRQKFAAWWPQIAYGEANPTSRDQNVAGSATDVVPVGFAQVSLKIDTIELAMPQEGHLCILGHNRLHLCQQRTMGMLWKMALWCIDHHPAERQSTPVIDHTQHQCQTAAASDAAVHHKLDWLSCQHLEELLCDRQKPALD